MLKFKSNAKNNFQQNLKIFKFEECEKILKNNYEKYLGWENIYNSDLDKINEYSKIIKENSNAIVICGIGGSYLGIRAIIEAIRGNLYHKKDPIRIFYLGNNLSPDYINNVLEEIKEYNISLIAISKSGTTMETVISYGMIKNFIINNYKDYKDRIYILTNEKEGYLRNEINKYSFKNLNIPEDIGGRYSVLSNVGIFPFKILDIDINELLKGAYDFKNYLVNCNEYENPCYEYAKSRLFLYQKNKQIEILATYNNNFEFFLKWYVQLFGESQGKSNDAIYPSYLLYTQDLHSMGQYVQDGPKNLFETIIDIKKTNIDFKIEDSNLKDIINYSLCELNNMAKEATYHAHINDDIPNLNISIDEVNEYNLGQLIYFFMKSCAVSSIMFNVNPFNQNGVEKYKSYLKNLMSK